jgi:uroporphyrinogen decarboxylase
VERILIPGSSTEPPQRLLRACFGLPVDRTPVWFMRQAGRYLPEYRELREKHSLLELCRRPELAAQLSLLPIRRMNVDAAIVFADILLPLMPMGAELDFVPGGGPRIANPVRSRADLARLKPVVVERDLDYVLETLRAVRAELPAEVSLIGFAGAPFTVASYLIEGGPSRHFERTKALMYGDPSSWHRLLQHLAEALGDFLLAQIAAGAQVVQLFDTWVGALSPSDYAEYAQPHSARVLARVAGSPAPSIHFGTGTAGLLPLMREAGGQVIGIDWRLPLDRAWALAGPEVGLQGNLDPMCLLAPRAVLEGQARRVLSEAGGRPGHIFNLGHGVLPQTPVASLQALVDFVHDATAVPAQPVTR